MTSAPAGERQVGLPRPQSGAKPRHLLVTLLGDYWSGRPEHLPSAALVALLGEFGISPAAARAALHRAGRGVVGAAEALRARTELMYDRLHFPGLDPKPPEELLPDDWPRRRAHEVFGELYDAFGPPAEIRVRQTVARSAPELAPLVRHHTHRDS